MLELRKREKYYHVHKWWFQTLIKFIFYTHFFFWVVSLFFNFSWSYWIIISIHHWIAISIFRIVSNYNIFNFLLNECFNFSSSYWIVGLQFLIELFKFQFLVTILNCWSNWCFNCYDHVQSLFQFSHKSTHTIQKLHNIDTMDMKRHMLC